MTQTSKEKREQETKKIIHAQVKSMLEDHDSNPWADFQNTTIECFDSLYQKAQNEGIDVVREIVRRDSIGAYHYEEGKAGMI